MTAWRGIGRLILATTLALSTGGCVTETVFGKNWAGATGTQPGLRLTPEAAFKAGVSGLVLLRCVVGPDQTANDCHVIVETTPNWGFAESALAMQPSLRVIENSKLNNKPLPRLGDHFTFPVAFCSQVSRKACETQMNQTLAIYGELMKPIEEMVDAGRCQDARKAAESISADYASVLADYCLPTTTARSP